MSRFFAISFSLLLVLSPLFRTVTSSAGNSPEDCLRCHEDMYARAMSYPNKHTVVRDGCTKCHLRKAAEAASTRISSATFQKDMIFHLGDLTEEGKKYLIEVEARDTDGNIAEPMVINTGNKETLRFPEEPYELKEISDIKVEKVEKKLLAKAVISWSTDVPTNSRLEYGTSEKNRNVLNSKNVYSKEHNVVLTGLRHKSKYTFTITSIDMNGKTLRSKEQIFDTTSAFDLTNKETALVNDNLKPKVKDAVLMNIGKRKGMFIRMSSNKPVEFKASLTKIKDEMNRPCVDFVPTRTSTIKVCIECHHQDASHPVGVSSKDPNIKIPDDLPVIENGVITCVTCHFAHGGETDYFLRINFTKEICLKCHPKKYM